jgi:hypothetical protein
VWCLAQMDEMGVPRSTFIYGALARGYGRVGWEDSVDKLLLDMRQMVSTMGRFDGLIVLEAPDPVRGLSSPTRGAPEKSSLITPAPRPTLPSK